MGFLTPLVDRLIVSLGMWLATSGLLGWMPQTNQSAVKVVTSPAAETAPSASYILLRLWQWTAALRRENAPQQSPAIRAERPAAAPLKIRGLDPALLQILQEWEAATSNISRIDCSFRRFVYDETFEVEKRADGELAFESPKKAKYVLRPSQIRKDEISRRKNPRGEAFRIVVDAPERWHWTGTQVLKIDERSRTYESVSLPPQAPDASSAVPPRSPYQFFLVTAFEDFWLARPFLLGMPTDEMLRRFKITLTQQTETEVWLDFEPRLLTDSMNYKKARLILDRTLMVPKAVQLVDPTGHRTTVHTFANVRINAPRPPKDDLGEPNLEGYRPMMNERPIPDGTDRTTEINFDALLPALAIAVLLWILVAP